METAINIVKNIVLPQFEKDKQYRNQKNTSEFWEQFTRFFLDFENDSKPVYAQIYSLELTDAEKIIDKLPDFYNSFTNDLAENYVLNQNSEATDYLISTNNQTFLELVQFYRTLQNVIIKVERKRIKQELPNLHEQLIFKLSETDIANATKKKGREDLKSKMKIWDEELQPVPVISMACRSEEKKSRGKVISLSWIKYAVAACVVLTAGIFYFKNTNSITVPEDIRAVTTDKKENLAPVKTVEEAVVLAEISTSSKKVSVLEPSSLGFTEVEKSKVIVNFVDTTLRITSLEHYLAKDIEKTDSKTVDKYQAELAALKIQNRKYSFDGKVITLYGETNQKQYAVFSTDDRHYFLKKELTFYYLRISKEALPLEKVTDATVLNTLEKIQFDNGK